MSDTWITDIRHLLDEYGNFPHDLPRPALNLGRHLTKIIDSATMNKLYKKPGKTNVKCRRKPKRKPCAGLIEANIQDDGIIRWSCPICHDNGYINGWQNTKWNKINIICA